MEVAAFMVLLAAVSLWISRPLRRPAGRLDDHRALDAQLRAEVIGAMRRVDEDRAP